MLLIKKENELRQIVAALEPVYGEEGGNYTRVYTTCGRVIPVTRRIKTVLQNQVGSYGLSITALRKKFGCSFGQTLYQPLPLAPGVVLVSAKMRQPLVGSDGATGYINACAVETIEKAAGFNPAVRCLVRLKGGHTLPSYLSPAVLQKRLNHGHLALELFLQQQGLYYPLPGRNIQDQPMIRASAGSNDYLATLSYLMYELVAEKEANPEIKTRPGAAFAGPAGK